MSNTENDIDWYKSSFSDSGGSGCVEVSRKDGVINVRDTKANGNGPSLVFTKPEMDAFIKAAKAGEFDKLVD